MSQIFYFYGYVSFVFTYYCSLSHLYVWGMYWEKMVQGMVLRADSSNSLKRSEVESANQLQKACLESRVVPRFEEPNLIGGKISLLLSFSLIDR